MRPVLVMSNNKINNSEKVVVVCITDAKGKVNARCLPIQDSWFLLYSDTEAVFISITSDAGSKWNKNVITMPVSRNQIIREKFIFYILLAVIGLITALIPCIVLMLAGADITVHSLCLYAAIGMSATLLAGGISLPCAYLFDPEKSQIVFMMSFMASTGVIVGLVLLTNLFIPVKDNIQLAFNIVLVISVVWFFISYRIAAAVYKNRDIV